jgi:O-succinylbenzoic acid--CoA ligase
MSELLINNFLLQNQDPGSTALIDSKLNLSYGQLLESVNETATALGNEGIVSGNYVGIIGKNNSNFIINALALWKISAIPVPINTHLTKLELTEQIDLANCNFVLISNELKSNYKNLPVKAIEYPAGNSSSEQETFRKEINPQDTAAVIFTSGSSQKPKGVKLSFNSFYQSGRIGNQLLRHTHSDRWLASLPFYHVGGFSIITRALLFGIPIIIPASLSTEDLTVSFEKFNPTLISLVSTQLKRLIDNDINPNRDLKNCLVGGGFTDDKLLRTALDGGWPVSKVYGTTETCSFVVALTADVFNSKPASVGKQIPPNKIRIVDENNDELNPYELGEVTIWTPALMHGYLKEQDDLQNKIVNEYYYTGDIGYLDEERFLFIEHRKNDLISSGGENVNPIEIENILKGHPSIEDAAVFPLKNKEWGEIVAAAVVLKDAQEKISTDDLQEYLKNNLAGFKVPKKIFIESELVTTEMGKIEKRKLIEMYSRD